MITYCPAYIFAARFGHCAYYAGMKRQPLDMLPLYEHIARKVGDLGFPCETLNDTSSIRNEGFDPLRSQQQTATTIAKLFLSVGTDTTRGEFLKRIGLRRLADLTKPILVEGRQSKAWLPWDAGWNVRERKLREPGPNEYHREAVYAQSCYFAFSGLDHRWRFCLEYGYSCMSDTSSARSSWTIEVCQGNEALSTFVNVTVPKWLDSVLEPDEGGECWRFCRNRDRDEIAAAVNRLFSEDYCGKASTLDALLKLLLVPDIYTPHKLHLTPRRLAALRRWKRDDDAREAKRQADLKKGG